MKNKVLKGATGVDRRRGVTFVKWNPSARSKLSPEVNEDCVGGTVIFQHDTCNDGFEVQHQHECIDGGVGKSARGNGKANYSARSVLPIVNAGNSNTGVHCRESFAENPASAQCHCIHRYFIAITLHCLPAKFFNNRLRVTRYINRSEGPVCC